MSLTSNELASMRSTAGEALPVSGTIYSQSYVSDGGGGGSVTWHAAGTVACRIGQTGQIEGREGQVGGRISPEAEYVVTMPYNATITTNSRIASGGTNYAVLAIRDRSWNISTRVEVKEEVP